MPCSHFISISSKASLENTPYGHTSKNLYRDTCSSKDFISHQKPIGKFCIIFWCFSPFSKYVLLLRKWMQSWCFGRCWGRWVFPGWWVLEVGGETFVEIVRKLFKLYIRVIEYPSYKLLNGNKDISILRI